MRPGARPAAPVTSPARGGIAAAISGRSVPPARQPIPWLPAVRPDRHAIPPSAGALVPALSPPPWPRSGEATASVPCLSGNRLVMTEGLGPVLIHAARQIGVRGSGPGGKVGAWRSLATPADWPTGPRTIEP